LNFDISFQNYSPFYQPYVTVHVLTSGDDYVIIY